MMFTMFRLSDRRWLEPVLFSVKHSPRQFRLSPVYVGPMIPGISSSVNGAVLKIRKIVPRLDFSSRAISARSFPAAYSSMTRMCRCEIPFRFAFVAALSRLATGDFNRLDNSQRNSPSFSVTLRRLGDGIST